MKKFFIFLVLLIIPFTVVNAKESKKTVKQKETKIVNKFIIECDAGKYYVGDQVICRTSIDSSYAYNKMSFKLETDKGLKITEVRSNYEQRWSISFKDNVVTSKTSKELQNGLQEFGILLVDASQSGELPIKVKSIVLENTKTKDTLQLENVETELKIISSDNELKEILVNGEEIQDFSSDKTTYAIDMKSDETLKIEAFTKNEFATLDGVGEYEIDDNNSKTIIPITVTSESGNSKVYTIIVNNSDYKDDGINKNIDSILLKNSKGDVILYDYKSDIYEYNIDVDSELDEITVVPSLENKDLSIVKKYGNQTIDLKYGNNIVLVKVKDSNDQENTYILNITRPLKNKSSNKYLSSLVIKGYNLDFSKKIKNYKLQIKKGTESLNIIAEPEDSKSIVNISGNSNLKEGSVIKITVTAENESKFVYNLNIEEVTEHSSSLIILFVVLFIFIVLLIIHKAKEKREIAKYNIEKEKLEKNQVKVFEEIKTNFEIESQIKDKELNESNPTEVKTIEEVRESDTTVVKETDKVNPNNTAKKNNTPKKKTPSKKTNNTSKNKTTTTKKKTNNSTKKASNAKAKKTTTQVKKTNTPNKTTSNKRSQNKKQSSVKKK